MKNNTKFFRKLIRFLYVLFVLQIINRLKASCSQLSDEELSKLSVNLLNCQSAVEGRTIFKCTDEMVFSTHFVVVYLWSSLMALSFLWKRWYRNRKIGTRFTFNWTVYWLFPCQEKNLKVSLTLLKLCYQGCFFHYYWTSCKLNFLQDTFFYLFS